MRSALREPAPRGMAVPGDAGRLMALVRECGGSGVARRALLLRLSSLRAARARPHHLRLAREALEPLAGADRAQQFELPNEDLVVVWRGDTPALPHCRDTLRHLFADDPALSGAPESLAELFEMPRDADSLMQAVVLGSLPPAAEVPARTAALPLDPPALAVLEQSLARADVSRFARREPVCRRVGDAMCLAWERRYLSDAELFETLLPDRAPRADKWLFRCLTRTLDRRLLAMLCAADELRGAAPFSVDLNVASLLGADFLRFDALLPAALRGQVLVNLRPEDVLADPARFLFARDFVRARGYRLLLQDVTAGQLALLPPARLGLDAMQLRWCPDLPAIDGLPKGASLVLGHADSAAALAWGRANGAGFYQGRMVRPVRW